jgi:hypothetical protein
MELQIFNKITFLKNYFLDLCSFKTGALGLILVTLFTADFISKYFSFPETVFKHAAAVAKLFLQLIIIILIFRRNNKRSIEILIRTSVFFLIFLLGHIYLKSENALSERIYLNLKILDWYIFIFILSAGYYAYMDGENSKKSNETLFKTLEVIYIIIFCSVIIGFLFEIEIFKAYYLGNRFGYNGILRNATHASYVFMLYILYFYYKRINYPNLKNKIFFYSTFLISILLSTKAILLFIILFCFYILFKRKSKRLLALFVTFLFLGIINYQWIIENVIRKYFNILYQLYLERGITTMLFSYRNESISKYFLPYLKENWSLSNYLFGGAEFNFHRTEFELIDLFWFFGIFGMMYFIWLFHKFILPFVYLVKYVPILIILLISFLAGSFFSSVPVMTILFVIILSLKGNSAHQVENNLKTRNVLMPKV